MAGNSVSGEDVTATHSKPAVSGALCATDLAGAVVGGEPAVGLCAPRHGDLTPGEGMAVGLCAPRLVPDPLSSLVPVESDSTVVMCAPGYPSVSASSSGDDHLTDRLIDRPDPLTDGGGGAHGSVDDFMQQWSQQHTPPRSFATSKLRGYTRSSREPQQRQTVVRARER